MAKKYRVDWTPTFTLPLTMRVRRDGYGPRVRGTADKLVAAGYLSQQIVDELPPGGAHTVHTPIGTIRVSRTASGDYTVDLCRLLVAYMETAAVLRRFGIEAQPDKLPERYYQLSFLYDASEHYDQYC